MGGAPYFRLRQGGGPTFIREKDCPVFIPSTWHIVCDIVG